MPNVLVAYDGSAKARAAVDWAAQLAADDGAVTVITVVPILTGAEPIADATDPASSPAEHRRQLREALELLAEQGVEASGMEAAGDEAEQIIEAAEARDVDVVVLGSRGLSPAKRFLIGSVSDRVVRHAPCSVLVVR